MLRRNQSPSDPDYYDVSFSGLKTALAARVAQVVAADALEEERPHLAAAFQEAAVEVLAAKTLRAVAATGCFRVLLGGGVSANRRLREVLTEELACRPGGRLLVGSPRISLDNGAMVARAGVFRLDRDGPDDLHLTPRADLPFPGLVRFGGT